LKPKQLKYFYLSGNHGRTCRDDQDVDFIVMGGYGHSRLREFVLGGVTGSMLRTMTAPVLMSR
jgi:nucleotide-binding universal stress UspA family protein